MDDWLVTRPAPVARSGSSEKNCSQSFLMTINIPKNILALSSNTINQGQGLIHLFKNFLESNKNVMVVEAGQLLGNYSVQKGWNDLYWVIGSELQ